MVAQKKPRVYPELKKNGDATTDQEEAQPQGTEEPQLGSEEAKPPDEVMMALFIKRIMRFALASETDDLGDDGDDNDSTKDAPGKKMPQFGELSFYSVTPDEKNELWRLEAERLVKAARGTVDGLVFPSKQAPAPLDHQGFVQLAKVMNMMLCALHICFLDDQMVLARFHRPSFGVARWSQSEFALRNRVDDSHRLPGQVSGLEIPSMIPSYKVAKDSHLGWKATYNKESTEEELDRIRRKRRTAEEGKKAEARGEEEFPFKIPQNHADPNRLGQVTEPEQYFAIVDHITAVIARIATECAPSSYWRTVVLACLVKLSAKLKVVTINLPSFAQLCLARGRSRDILKPARGHYQEALAAEVPFKVWAGARINDDDDLVSRYCVENATVGGWLGNCILHLLEDLGARWPLHAPLGHLDLCALVFRSGVRRLPTLMHQDRHGNIGGSSEALPLVFSTSAMHLAADLGREVAKQALPNKTAAGEGPDTKAHMEVSWEKERADGGVDVEREAIALANVANVVTVLVPLSLAKPSLAQEFKLVLQAMSALSAFGEISPPAIDFTASVSLRLEETNGPAKADTKEFKGLFKKGLSRHKLQTDIGAVLEDSNSLSASLLANRRLNLFDHNAPDIMFPADEETVKRTIEDANTILVKMERVAKEWDIDEVAVVVKCPVYVCIVVFCSAVLVLGGLLFGFLVGNRIVGVDPFGITTFTWVVAGFVILVAKSVRVSDWPWREFLRGRVTCRSVTELRSVTGMDAQDIIRFFLSTQDENKLKTRGPFNKPFRTGGNEGFSIDVKPELETLISCGLIPLKVSTLQGPCLVYLDLTPGPSRLTNTDRSMRISRPMSDYLCCLEPPAPGAEGDAALGYRSNITWIKVLGLYNRKGMRFR
jgi:hypothetical protein